MIPSNVYNYTDFGIHSNNERYFWAVYHAFVFLSSLIGDTLILYGSSQRNAFRLNKFILTVMQHIALTDLACAICNVLPKCVSLLANAWVMGETICYGRAFLGRLFYVVGIWLIAVLTVSKLLLLKYPIRCGSWTKKMAHIVCSITLIPTAILPILSMVAQDVEFDYRIYVCDYVLNDVKWEKHIRFVKLIFTAAIFFPPNVIIVATTIPTLMYLSDARKSARGVQGRIPWQGTVTVVLTAAVYCCSTLPTFIYHIISSSNAQAFRLATFSLSINIMSNFYIYALTISGFRKLILSKMATLLPISLQPIRKTASTGKI